MNFSKALLPAVLALVFGADVVAHTYKSHKFQVVLSPNTEGWEGSSFWALNTTSDGLVYDFNTMRNLGSYYVAKGLIFPRGTVSKNQADYSVDKDNVSLLDVDSLGMWISNEFVLVEYDNGEFFPVAETVLTDGTWVFMFNNSTWKDNLYAAGRQKAHAVNPSSNEPEQYGRFEVTAGSGKYAHAEGRPSVIKSKWYLSTAGNVLIKVTFDEAIEVHY